MMTVIVTKKVVTPPLYGGYGNRYKLVSDAENHYFSANYYFISRLLEIECWRERSSASKKEVIGSGSLKWATELAWEAYDRFNGLSLEDVNALT